MSLIANSSDILFLNSEVNNEILHTLIENKIGINGKIVNNFDDNKTFINKDNYLDSFNDYVFWDNLFNSIPTIFQVKLTKTKSIFELNKESVYHSIIFNFKINQIQSSFLKEKIKNNEILIKIDIKKNNDSDAFYLFNHIHDYKFNDSFTSTKTEDEILKIKEKIYDFANSLKDKFPIFDFESFENFINNDDLSFFLSYLEQYSINNKDYPYSLHIESSEHIYDEVNMKEYEHENYVLKHNNVEYKFSLFNRYNEIENIDSVDNYSVIY